MREAKKQRVKRKAKNEKERKKVRNQTHPMHRTGKTRRENETQ